MLEKISDALEGVRMTIVGGVFLLLSFIMSKTEFALPIDPAWVTVIICGTPLVISAIRKTAKNKGISKISSAHLISVAMIAAIIIGDLFAAGEVAFIMAVGEILEDMTTDRAKKGLKNLISLSPTAARRIYENNEEMISVDDILKDDILRILPGETIPVDGVIISGETTVDQSVMTGESIPVDKSVGDEVFSGTINRFGTVDIRASRVGEDSSLQKLIRMVKEAEKKKAPMARTADTAASWLVPLALVIAIITGFATRDIVRAVTVLVVFCPCALVLATPTAIMAAIGQATKHGVVIKSGEALEKMGKIDAVAFDKTGTLTMGRLAVSNIISFAGDDSELVSLAASIESKSEHPLGRAIVAYAVEKSIGREEVSDFKMTAGGGANGILNGKNILCGNEKYLKNNEITLSESEEKILENLRREGKASVIVAEDGKCIGLIALSDVMRPNVPKAVAELAHMGTDSVLLTGDNALSAEYFAKQAGISEIRAELMPEEKVKSIEELQKKGKAVCMIGDGVNDAPALKSASVGIAMGSMGSDIAVEAADIALVGDDISKLPYLKRLSNATLKTIKFSITLSMLINFAAVVLSVRGVLNPTTGALVHNAGSCFVILISALLYDRKFE